MNCPTSPYNVPSNPEQLNQDTTPHTILLVAGSPQRVSETLLQQLAEEHDLIIACDSALNVCASAQVTPDIAVGDFDSVDQAVLESFLSSSTEVITSHWHKDATDIGMAFELINERYAHMPVTVTLTSCTGGRLDHQLALIGKMVEFAHLHPAVQEDYMSAYILHADYRSSYKVPYQHQFKTASAIAVTAHAELSLSGFEWDLDRATFTLLDQGDLAGTSNIIKEKEAFVEVHQGALIFIVNELREDKKLKDLGIFNEV